MAGLPEQYSGAESFKHIDKLIASNDRELLIISPYISDYYTRKLLRQKRKRIRVITSEGSVAKGKLLASLHKTQWRSYAQAIIYFAVLAGIFAYIRIAYAALASLAFVAGIAIVFAHNARKGSNSNIEVKSTGKQFIHEKMYIGDNIAIVGSANLTFSGMHKNIEHIEIISDAAYIAKLKSHFEVLWKSY
ncbi:MAG: phospholipase D-like domain-containing protein [Candidatus Marsarchaeota archaeon]|jgi:phosphatidylserine/phosphatidylglycerophosphate/cardiolipin synthase-like enzyme|nr:phospholipase D-like domain-containing protein [Candidatus Marsarchaeota archaeon]MCL5419051.1 phospholipase D-like domain-containing protein [Candidatus Marsarchaeota archaeon]